MTKTCTKCRTEKPLAEFHPDRRSRDGASVKCLDCHTSIRKDQKRSACRTHYKRYGAARHAPARAAWHARNPNKQWEYHQKKYEKPHGRAMHLFNGAKSRRPDGFTLTLEYVAAGIERGHCAVTGIPFDFRVNRKQGLTRSPFAPSLDKIKPKGPYTNENTRVVIWQYNAMKGELSDSELLEICKQVVANSP